MADQLDILIKTTADKAGAEQTAAALKDVKKVTTEVGTASTETAKAGVQAEKEIQAETKKTFAGKKDLKDAVQGLREEFPLLANVARMALNPITLVTAGLAASWQIWKTRVDELTKSLGGVEMPDLSEDAISRMERNAAAWGKLAENISKASGNLSAMKKDAHALVKTIEFNDSLKKALGIDTGDTAAKQKAEVLGIQAARLEATGQAKVAAASRLGSPENDAKAVADAKAVTAKATVDKAEAEARLADILKYRAGEMNPLQQAKFGAQYYLRYGMTPGPEAMDMERANIAAQQGLISGAQRTLSNAAGRGAIRAGRAEGEEQIAQAEALRAEIAELRRGAIVDMVTKSRTGSVEAGGRATAAGAAGDIGGTLVAVADIGKQFAALAAALQQARNENAAALQRLNNGTPR